MSDKISIRNHYIEYVLENGKKPASVFSFAKHLKISESDFYNFYTNFEAIEQDVWKSIFVETLETLESDKTYQDYQAKDKLLAFYYMWVQKMRANRSFIMMQKCSKTNSILPNADGLEAFKKVFYTYMAQIIQTGIDNNEIKDRKFLTDKYVSGYWFQTLFVLNYWLKDTSTNFEMTDAAIEKIVNLGFKLISDNAIDSLVDFGKFMFQKSA